MAAPAWLPVKHGSGKKNAIPIAPHDAAFGPRLRWLREPGNAALLRGGLRGVEKESLRVRSDGALSHGTAPARLGAALTHPYLTTDYSEALPEFVTPPQRSNWETLQFLCDLHAFAYRIWTTSCSGRPACHARLTPTTTFRSRATATRTWVS